VLKAAIADEQLDESHAGVRHAKHTALKH